MSTRCSLFWVLAFLFGLYSAPSFAFLIEKEGFWEQKLKMTLLARDVWVRGRIGDIFSVNTAACDLDCIHGYLKHQGLKPYRQANMMTWWYKSRLVTLVVEHGKGLTNGYLIESSAEIPGRDLDFPFGRKAVQGKIIDIGSMDDTSVNHTWIVIVKARSDFDVMVRHAKAKGFRTAFSRIGKMEVMDKGDEHMVMSMVETSNRVSVMINLTKGHIN